MGSSHRDEQPSKISRRALIMYGLDKLVIPATVGSIAGFAAAFFSRRNEPRHRVSISIIRSDSAAPRESSGDPFVGLFEPPTPAPTPDLIPRYTYTTLIRNNGDFTEEQVTMAISFRTNVQNAAPISSPEIDASSSLLAETIVATDPVDPLPSYAMTVGRFTPGEWISLKTSWLQPMRVTVHVRSDSMAESDSI